MTIRIIDGFDYMPGVTVDNSMWQAMGWSGDVDSMSAMDDNGGVLPAFGYGKMMGFGGASNYDIYKDLRGRYTESLDHVIFGCRMYVPVSSPIMQIFGTDTQTVSANDQWKVTFTAYGNIDFYGPNLTTLVGRSKAWAFNPGRWFYFEMKFRPGLGTDGMVEFRVNTVVVLSIPATATAIGTLTGGAGGLHGVDLLHFKTGGSGSGRHMIDDMYFLDSAGAQNNDYLGNTRVKYMPPNGPSLTNWTIGGTAPAATNWQSASNNLADDTKYVASSTPGQRDLYTVDPNLNTPYVFGVEIDGVYRQDDATQRVVKNTIQTGTGTDADGADHYCNAAYTTSPDIFELNPDTGVAWTGAEVNAMKIGPEVVT